MDHPELKKHLLLKSLHEIDQMIDDLIDHGEFDDENPETQILIGDRAKIKLELDKNFPEWRQAMTKGPEIIETAEVEKVAFSPEEIMTTDELPITDLVIVEEPLAVKKDYSESQNLGDFMEWITGKMNNLPPHSGKTTAGCERVIAHLKMLDKEISKAISRDVDCELDDQAVEKFRKDIRKMVKKLDKRHKEINEAYDADDEKFASSDGQIKNALIFPGELSKPTTTEEHELNNWMCPKCHKEVKPGDEEHVERHKAMCVANAHSNKLKTAEEESNNEADDKNSPSYNKLYCKLCGAQFADRRGAKAHAEIKHQGENVTFSDTPPPGKTASACACHVEKKSDDNCPTCNIKLWKAAEDLYECISCEAVFERPLTKEAGTAKLTLVMSPFERAITGAIVNSFVSQGKNPEETYATLKKKYKFTDRDELSIQQVLADMGYPILKDRGHLGDGSEKLNKGEGVEFSTQYNA